MRARRVKRSNPRLASKHPLSAAPSRLASKHPHLPSPPLQTPQFMCDVIWRLYRPLILGCEKPRLHNWDEDGVHGGSPLDVYPFWSKNESGDQFLTLYKLADFLEEFYRYRRGSADKPSLDAARFIERAHVPVGQA